MITDEQLAVLTDEQRADLAHRIAAMSPPRAAAGGPGTAWRLRRWLPLAALAGCALLAGWIAALTLTLPHRYLTQNWDTAWIGFDTALLAGLAATAWTAWRASPALPPVALTTAVLLLCDAWFDVTTAATAPDLTESVIGLAVEVPAAVALLLAVRGLTRRS